MGAPSSGQGGVRQNTRVTRVGVPSSLPHRQVHRTTTATTATTGFTSLPHPTRNGGIGHESWW